ncbi:MAG: APC family permease [Thermaerobacter sp.]|nr:APC family permease [Thermaerobacter sp.]
MPAWTAVWLAAGMLSASLWLNVRGVQVAGWMQVAWLALIVLLVVTAIVGAVPYVRAAAFHPSFPDGWLSVGSSAVIIFWSFVGWEMVAHLAEEFRDPRRDLPRTFILAQTVVGVLYTALAVVTVGTGAYRHARGLAPLSRLVGLGFGGAGAAVTRVVALLVTVVAIDGNVCGFSRMLYAPARLGEFPAVFGRLHPRHHTPVGALAGLGVDFALVLGVYGGWRVNLGTLVRWPRTIFLVPYIMAMASALRLLRGEPAAQIMALIPLSSAWGCSRLADGHYCIR